MKRANIGGVSVTAIEVSGPNVSGGGRSSVWLTSGRAFNHPSSRTKRPGEWLLEAPAPRHTRLLERFYFWQSHGDRLEVALSGPDGKIRRGAAALAAGPAGGVLVFRGLEPLRRA